MGRCISFSPCTTNEHGRHASTTTKNNVYGNRDIIAEGEVIEKVDGKEEHNIREPPSQGHSSGSEEEGGVCYGEVRGPGEQSC